jgi:hypothetical protein
LHSRSVPVQEGLQAAQHRLQTDPHTGQPLFRLQIIRTSAAYPRCTADLGIGDYLYARRHERDERQCELEAAERESARRERAPHVNRRSEAMLTRLKERRFAQIFEYLDDGSGTVDLLSVVLGSSQRIVNLSAKIRHDMEAAAVLKCHVEGVLQVPVTAEVLQNMGGGALPGADAGAGGA